MSEILAIVNEVPLAHWKVEAGLNLRQAMFINGILFNSEAWHSITINDVLLLEKVDEALLRGLLKAHSKIPLEALFLETKSLPIRFTLSSRRLMYLHSILQKDEGELVKNVYNAQKDDVSPGDFCELVEEDKIQIGLNMTDIEISGINKQQFKKIVKTKIRQAAFEFLKNLQKNHSKMSGINYEAFEMRSYMNSPLFNCDSRKLLLALRMRTVEGIKNDFRGQFVNTICPLVGCNEKDTLENLLTCNAITTQLTSDNIATSDIKYLDIFSSAVIKQRQVTVVVQTSPVHR